MLPRNLPHQEAAPATISSSRRTGQGASWSGKDRLVLELVDVGGLRVAVRRRGRGEPVLLVHGGMSDSREWGPQVAEEGSQVARDPGPVGVVLVAEPLAEPPFLAQHPSMQ